MNKFKLAAATCALGLSLTACGGNSSTATKTVTATPQSCIDALDTAEALVSGPVASQTADSATLAKLVGQAYEAGATGNMSEANSVLDSLTQITADTKTRTAEIKTLVDKYKASSKECRAGRN